MFEQHAQVLHFSQIVFNSKRCTPRKYLAYAQCHTCVYIWGSQLVTFTGVTAIQCSCMQLSSTTLVLQALLRCSPIHKKHLQKTFCYLLAHALIWRGASQRSLYTINHHVLSPQCWTYAIAIFTQFLPSKSSSQAKDQGYVQFLIQK